MTELNEFKPDWVSAPGDTIADILEEKNLSFLKFAQAMGQTPDYAKELLKGYATIAIESVRHLEDILCGSAAFWLTRESQYREDVARLDRDELGAITRDWVRGLPVKDID